MAWHDMAYMCLFGRRAYPGCNVRRRIATILYLRVPRFGFRYVPSNLKINTLGKEKKKTLRTEPEYVPMVMIIAILYWTAS